MTFAETLLPEFDQGSCASFPATSARHHTMRAPRPSLAGFLAVLAACTAPRPAATDGPPRHLLRSAAQFYDAYVQDVRAHRREKLARYYHASGALIVLGGQGRHLSRAAIDSFYREVWRGPTYFAWDTLAFDSLSAQLVLVTGRFRWVAPGARDTARYIYAAILEAVDSGLALRLEHETLAPPHPK